MATTLRITQKGRDLIRVAASLAAYAVIGTLTAAGLYILCLGMIAAGEVITGR